LATWEELSRDSLRAAKLLANQGHLRSSISRAYYAAYCAIAEELSTRRVRFPRGWHNPAHEQLPDLIAHNLSLPQLTRRRLNKLVRLLRRAREDADYRPGIPIDHALALDCILDATVVLRELGIRDD
jgi:uncharacterized protein (UPF0332 family)